MSDDDQDAPRTVTIREFAYSHRVDMVITTVQSVLIAIAAVVAVVVSTRAALIGFLAALVLVYGTSAIVASGIRRDDSTRTSPEEVERYVRRKRRAELWAVCVIAALGIVLHTS